MNEGSRARRKDGYKTEGYLKKMDADDYWK